MVLKENDIILVKTNRNIISKIIHKVTKDVYNHAELYLGNYIILDAMPNGVKVRPFDNKLGEFDCYRYKGKITASQKAKINEFIQKNINNKYDFIALVMQLFNIQFDTPKKYICIELVLKAYEYAGLPVGKWQKGFKQVTDSIYFRKVNK